MDNLKYDVFISYSRKDYLDEGGNVRADSEVAKILEELQKANISFWIDKEGVKHGEDFGETILNYIIASKIFVFLSTVEANRSEWTRNEIACALMYKKKIIPVCIDESPFHNSVMFRIVALDRIKYYLSPKKGREELIDSVKRYLAEEQAAAARREAEEQRKREEEELQLRQQEELRRKQQQADELRTEIGKTQEECTALEKELLQKKHDVEVVNAELNTKLKQLDEQKQQMNAILHDDEDKPLTPESLSPVASVVQEEDYGFQFKWLHPLSSFREMWQKTKETARKRHWTVSLILWLYFATSAFLSLGYFAKIYTPDATLFVSAILISYALFQLLLGKRSGIGLLLFTPVLILLVTYFYDNDLCCRFFCDSWDMSALPIVFIGSFLLFVFVIPILMVRKGGKSAWSLLEGKVVHALNINKNACYYFAFCALLLISISYFESQTKKCIYYVNETTAQLEKITKERDSLIAERNTLGAMLKDGYGYSLYTLAEKCYDKKLYKEATICYKLAEEDSTSCTSRYIRKAQYKLGIIYEQGLGGIQSNKKKALQYYIKAKSYYYQDCYFYDAFDNSHYVYDSGYLSDASEAYMKLKNK